MFQIKLTKPIKPSRSNCTAIGRKTDPNRYALVLIITKPILIDSVTNLKKKTKPTELRTPLAPTVYHLIGNCLRHWMLLLMIHLCSFVLCQGGQVYLIRSSKKGSSLVPSAAPQVLGSSWLWWPSEDERFSS